MRVKYILPLILGVFAFSIFSQQPQWQFVTFGSPNGGQVTLPIYMTQLVYKLNVSQNTSAQFIQVTIPQSILQQQLQYCKTYDPFISNNISLLQCAFAYPSIVIVYTISGSTPNNAYEIPYNMIIMSYDNVTGLPQTFQIYLNNHIGALNPGLYFVYVYYGGPYYFPYASMTSNKIPSCPSLGTIQYATPSDFDGGWCGAGGGIFYSYPWGQGYNTGSNTERYLFVKFNPQYPVLVELTSSSGSVTVENPSTGQTATLSINGGVLYDLRLLEQQNGLNLYQWNEIVDINLVFGWINGFFLIYTPQT
jgi:hypothetical protein